MNFRNTGWPDVATSVLTELNLSLCICWVLSALGKYLGSCQHFWQPAEKEGLLRAVFSTRFGFFHLFVGLSGEEGESNSSLDVFIIRLAVSACRE